MLAHVGMTIVICRRREEEQNQLARCHQIRRFSMDTERSRPPWAAHPIRK